MKKKELERRKGLISLIFLALAFASIGLFPRYLSRFLLFQQIYLRQFAAFAIGLLVFYKDLNLKKFFLIPSKEWILLIFRAVSYFVIGVTLFTKAIILTKISNVTFIGAFPITAIFGFLILKEKFTMRKLLLVVLASVGVVTIAVKDFSSIFSWGTGEILSLTAAIFFSLGTISRKWHNDFLNDKEITILTLFISAILTLAISFFIKEGSPLNHWNYGLLGVVLLAGAVNTAITFLINYGYSRIDAVLANTILDLDVLFVVLLAYLFFREFPQPRELLGGLIIIISVFMMHRLELTD